MGLLSYLSHILFPPERPDFILGEVEGLKTLEKFFASLKSRNGYPSFLAIRGDYGMGKSHWLKYIWNRSRDCGDRAGKFLSFYVPCQGVGQLDLRQFYFSLFRPPYGFPRQRISSWFQKPTNLPHLAWQDDTLRRLFCEADLSAGRRFAFLSGQPLTATICHKLQQAGIDSDYICGRKFSPDKALADLFQWILNRPHVRPPLLLVLDELDRLTPGGCREFADWTAGLRKRLGEDRVCLVWGESSTYFVNSLKKVYREATTSLEEIKLQGPRSVKELSELRDNIVKEHGELKSDYFPADALAVAFGYYNPFRSKGDKPYLKEVIHGRIRCDI